VGTGTAPTGRRGRPRRYSDVAIEAGLMLRLAFGRPWRQTEGWTGPSRMGSTLSAPSAKVDAIYTGPTIETVSCLHKVEFQVSSHEPEVKGFAPLPLRWCIFSRHFRRWHKPLPAPDPQPRTVREKRDRLAVLADQSAWLAVWDKSNRNPGEAWAESANGAGWASLAGIAGYKGVSRL
jgi:Transposase DDE domain